MTRYAPLWQQANAYPATLDRSLMAALWPRGGAIGNPPAAVANAMTISIPPGSLAVPLQAGQGVALCVWDAAEVTPPLQNGPPAGQTRIDLVVCQVRDNAIDGGPNNDFVFQVVTGVPAASNPAVPATPANAYAVAQVTVPATAVNLNAATVTDVRSFLGGVPHGQIYLTAAASVIGSTNVIQPMAAQFPPRNGMRVVGNTLVVPVPGIYRVAWSGYGGATATMAFCLINPYRNGATIATASGGPNSGSFVSIGGTTDVLCAAGDALDLRGSCQAGQFNLQPGVGNVWLSAALLTP